MTSNSPTKRPLNQKQICVLGSGAWGSVIARIVARNVLFFRKFHPKVYMYVFEEFVDEKPLTEIINKEHENIKYAKGYKFTNNLVATPDAVEAAKNADILIFVTPHQFIDGLCKTLKGRIKPTAIGVSLIKGFERKPGGGIDLISKTLSKSLRIPCYVLMGANIANEVAAEKIVCTSTVGCNNKKHGKLLKDIFNTDHLKITVVQDADTVEVCGALKNIVATGVGFLDGLDQDLDMKAALLRLGFMEMVQFIDQFYPGGKVSTFFESCGITDLIITSLAGRNRKCAEAFVRTGKPLEQLERELLGGGKLQGPPTAAEVMYMLRAARMTEEFPIFAVIEEVGNRTAPPDDLVKCIKENMGKYTYIPKTLTI